MPYDRKGSPDYLATQGGFSSKCILNFLPLYLAWIPWLLWVPYFNIMQSIFEADWEEKKSLPLLISACQQYDNTKTISYNTNTKWQILVLALDKYTQTMPPWLEWQAGVEPEIISGLHLRSHTGAHQLVFVFNPLFIYSLFYFDNLALNDQKLLTTCMISARKWRKGESFWNTAVIYLLRLREGRKFLKRTVLVLFAIKREERVFCKYLWDNVCT